MTPWSNGPFWPCAVCRGARRVGGICPAHAGCRRSRTPAGVGRCQGLGALEAIQSHQGSSRVTEKGEQPPRQVRLPRVGGGPNLEVGAEIAAHLGETGNDYAEWALRGALLSGVFWLVPFDYAAYDSDDSLNEIEEFTYLVNAFAQSMPLHPRQNEPDDAQLQRFYTFQRRRYGYETPLRVPRQVTGDLSPHTIELIDAYEDRLLSRTPESAHMLATNIAVAIGRPVDETISHQIELALATALAWRHMTSLPSGPDAHPLLGIRNQNHGLAWDEAARAIARCLDFLYELPEGASNPASVQSPSWIPIAGVEIDGESLTALARLNEYVSVLAEWMSSPQASQLEPAARLPVFDQMFRERGSSASNGYRLLVSLPAGALDVVVHFNDIQDGPGQTEIANEYATALGDRDIAPSCLLTLRTAVAWLNGQLSALELQSTTSAEMQWPVEPQLPPELEPFLAAPPSDAQSLLEFGSTIVDIVRFSQTLEQSGATPAGFWLKFHGRELENLPTPRALLESLSDGARRLLKQHSEVLAAGGLNDPSLIARALASRIEPIENPPVIYTLAVGLATGAVWMDMNRISRGRRGNSLLGASPGTEPDRRMCELAQAQLEWGLQATFHTDSIVGV